MKIKRALKLNVVNGIITIFSVLLSMFLILNVFKYAKISINLFMLSIFIVMLLNILSVLLDIKAKGHPTLRKISIIYSLFLLVIILLGNYYFLRIGGTISEVIIDTEKTQYENITTSFITFDDKSINELEDVFGKVVGFVDNENIQEGNLLAKEELLSKNIDVTYKPYSNYTNLLLALFNQEIDVAPLPVDYYSMFISNEGFEEYLEKTSVIYSFESRVEYSGQDQTNKDISKDPFTILMIGNADGLSDTLILATFNPKTMTATMTSIARDSFVPIACYPDSSEDKITHARSVSRQCTIDTVSNLLDVEIDYFLEVNFQAVVDVVDALEGLYLYSPVEFVGQDASSIRGTYTVWVGEGWQQMDGLQSLAFARERKSMPNGDLDRQKHQQEVISAIIAKLMDTKNIGVFIDVIEAAGTNVKTNIPLAQMTNLADYLINMMSVTSINSSYLLQIKNSRLSGYFSWDYNEKLELPLSIFKLYSGAIEDAKELIAQNLMLEDYQATANKYFNFDIKAPYVNPIYVSDYYDEVEIHEKLPDFMPSMASTSKSWYFSDVQTWAQARPWINLTIDEVWPDESQYNNAFGYNQVVYQTTKYGVLTSKITDLTVGVIKRDLDCSIEENREDPQCINIVPNFVGMKLSDVDAWSIKFNFPVKIEYIYENETNYDRTKLGVITSQAQKAYAKLNQLDVEYLTLYTMAYPMVNLPAQNIVDEHWTKQQIEDWFKLNMHVKPIYVYLTSPSIYPKDTVVAVKINNIEISQNTAYQSNTIVTFVLSSGNLPVSTNLSFTTSQNVSLNGILQGSSSQTSSLTFSIVTGPQNGVVNINQNGAFIYTPNTNFLGNDNFTYKIFDGLFYSNPANVDIIVN